MRLKIQQNFLHLLLVANVAEAFRVGSNNHVRGITSLRSSTTDDQDAKPKAADVPKPKKEKRFYIKNEREKIAKKKDFYRGAGVFRDVKAEVTEDMKQQFDSDLMNEMKDTPNYMVERDGVEFYLAKDHGFCWGVERSINLAYSAVETFPESKIHITNELIHNPMVNDRLHSKNVNFIQKDEDNNKDFSQIKEGDVVMLPAFGATLDEMK
jgi:4-hydroxy-3-methylbut-2-enyl diphosphate reductase